MSWTWSEYLIFNKVQKFIDEADQRVNFLFVADMWFMRGDYFVMMEVRPMLSPMEIAPKRYLKINLSILDCFVETFEVGP